MHSREPVLKMIVASSRVQQYRFRPGTSLGELAVLPHTTSEFYLDPTSSGREGKGRERRERGGMKVKGKKGKKSRNTCRLTAKNRDQHRNPTLGNRVWAKLTLNLPYRNQW